MVLKLTEENERLNAELEQTRKDLLSKKIIISEAGDIAEASLKLNRVFEAAQDAAVQYLGNIQILEKRKQAELEKVRQLRARLDEKKE